VRIPSPFEVEIAIAKLKKYKSPVSDEIPAELIQAGDETLQSEIHKLVNSVWSEEELPNQCKMSIIVSIRRRAIKLAVVIIEEYVDEIVGDHQCVFRRNRTATDQIFCIRQITGEK
jgi:hypothetical protein